MKKKDNKRKGFTLVELLAALVILGILTLVAAPNIVGILQRTKINTYISDANKLVSLAEYKYRGSTTIPRADGSRCTVLTMSTLGTSEFKNAPYGGTYDENKSYVIIKKEGTKYVYYVQILEVDDGKYSGIAIDKRINSTLLGDESKVFDKIATKMSSAKTYSSSGLCSSYVTG